jgi:hypothetical protein
MSIGWLIVAGLFYLQGYLQTMTTRPNDRFARLSHAPLLIWLLCGAPYIRGAPAKVMSTKGLRTQMLVLTNVLTLLALLELTPLDGFPAHLLSLPFGLVVALTVELLIWKRLVR